MVRLEPRLLSSRHRGQDISMCLRLFPKAYFAYVSSEGSGETARMCRLIRALAARRRYKLQNPMYWFIHGLPLMHLTR